MFEMFWLIAAIPLLIPFAAKLIWKSKITFLEMSVQVCVALVVSMLLWNVGKYNQIADVEIWNGEVVEKFPRRESCPIGWVSYSDGFCRHYITRTVKVGETCTTDSNGRRSCTPIYQTQYNYTYSWEQNWYVKGNIGKTWEIARADRRGAREPERWTRVVIGDPVSKTNTYENYVKAASSSLFNKEQGWAERYAEHIPEYPSDIYDYYKVDRVLTTGNVQLSDPAAWNTRLAEILALLGPERQANVVVVFTDLPPTFAQGVIAAWQGGKKNDILVFIGTQANPKTVDWVEINSWSKNDFFNVELRDSLSDMEEIGIEPVMARILQITMEEFERRPMAEFEYLKDEVEPSGRFLVFMFVFTILISVGLTWLMHRIDLDEMVKELFNGLTKR